MKTGHSIFALALLGLAVAAEGQVELDRTSAVSADGTIIRVMNGFAGELLPEDESLDPEASILVLDLSGSEERTGRLVVPTTETEDPEDSETLVLDSSRGVTYLLWQSHLNGIHPRLHLISFDGEEWSEVDFLGSGPFSDKGRPHVAMVAEEDGRTLLNVAWWQEVGLETWNFFSPVVLEEGTETGQIPLLNLNEFFDEVEESAPVQLDLQYHVAIGAGGDLHSVVASWFDSVSGRFRTARLELLPRALGVFADGIRAQIIGIGIVAGTTPDFSTLVADAIVESGAEFHASASLYLAESVRLMIEDAGSSFTEEEVMVIADQARAQVIGIGSRIDVGGLSEDGVLEIIEIPAGDEAPPHLMSVAPLLDLELPAEIGAVSQVFVSPEGGHVLIAWELEGAIGFREFRDGEWTENVTIAVNEALTAETVFDMLRNRL